MVKRCKMVNALTLGSWVIVLVNELIMYSIMSNILQLYHARKYGCGFSLVARSGPKWLKRSDNRNVMLAGIVIVSKEPHLIRVKEAPSYPSCRIRLWASKQIGKVCLIRSCPSIAICWLLVTSSLFLTRVQPQTNDRLSSGNFSQPEDRFQRRMLALFIALIAAGDQAWQRSVGMKS